MTTLTAPRQAAIAGRMRQLQARYEHRLMLALDHSFATLARRVVARYEARTIKVAVSDLFTDEDDDLFVRVFMTILRGLILDVGALAAQMAGGQPFEQDNAGLLALLAKAGQRIRHINDETRSAVERVLTEGTARGYSPYEIARGVARDNWRGLGEVVKETYRGRAQTIARTEVATEAQHAAHDRYGTAGITEIEFSDGPTCGLQFHDDPDKADGMIVDLDTAQQWPLSHPNCRRISLPRLETRRRA